MSGIYVEGLKMPNGCSECYLNMEYGECAAMEYRHLGDYRWKSSERHKNCPLTVDAVPVVRCRDCKHRNGDYCHNNDGFAHGGNFFFVRQNDFCSLGEQEAQESTITYYAENAPYYSEKCDGGANNER